MHDAKRSSQEPLRECLTDPFFGNFCCRASMASQRNVHHQDPYTVPFIAPRSLCVDTDADPSTFYSVQSSGVTLPVRRQQCDLWGTTRGNADDGTFYCALSDGTTDTRTPTRSKAPSSQKRHTAKRLWKFYHPTTATLIACLILMILCCVMVRRAAHPRSSQFVQAAAAASTTVDRVLSVVPPETADHHDGLPLKGSPDELIDDQTDSPPGPLENILTAWVASRHLLMARPSP